MQELTVSVVLDYINSQTIEVAGNYGRGYHLKLQYTVGGSIFQVLDHGSEVYRGGSAADAIAAFRELQPNS